MIEDALIVARFVHFAGLFGAFGIAAFRAYALDPGEARCEGFLTDSVRTAALVALAGAVATVPCVAAGMAGTSAAAFDPATLDTVMARTMFGHVWCGHLALLIGLVVASLRPGRVARGCALALSALALVSLGWVGHAAMHRGWAGLGHELNQAVHLLAGGAWLGGLWPLSVLLRRARRDGVWLGLARHALPHFSQMGYIAVALIAVTGAINAVFLVGSVAAFATTPYGRLLAFKVALYLAMVAVALGNRFRLAPRLARDDAPLAALSRAVFVEQALGILILAVVSVLGTWPPAAMP